MGIQPMLLDAERQRGQRATEGQSRTRDSVQGQGSGCKRTCLPEQQKEKAQLPELAQRRKPRLKHARRENWEREQGWREKQEQEQEQDSDHS
mmetsp:Transcript_42891/g.135339  ORF Transcript_42891/g.135339 Transcript_42891/m.135339 type:complete len:92 (+) Transcript_42891:1058-1333(+)